MLVKYRSGFILTQTAKKNFHNFYFTRGINTKDILKGDQVSVYEASEWQEMEEFLRKSNYFSLLPKNKTQIEYAKNAWIDCVMKTQFKEKYFALLPFFLENTYSLRAKKRFVLKMDLFPESKHLMFKIALESGISTVYEPLSDFIPLTPNDYKAKHMFLRSAPPHFVDMDMIYGNYKLWSMYCFDKTGTWVQEVRINSSLYRE